MFHVKHTPGGYYARPLFVPFTAYHLAVLPVKGTGGSYEISGTGMKPMEKRT